MKPVSLTENPLIVRDPECLALGRRRVQAGDRVLRPALLKLRADADAARHEGPFTIVDKEIVPPSGDKHDYISRGPYWWPNPETEDGLPYVRRDGEVNPERDAFDRPTLQAMIDAVETLALGWAFTGEPAYAERAVLLLRTFFLDEATRMNPNLTFGQGIPGRCEGRGIGIIETRTLASRLVDAIIVLRASAACEGEDWAGLRSWFEDYLDWLLESDHGQDEAQKENNHGTAYDLQVAVFSIFVGREGAAWDVLSAVGDRRIATQVEPDGAQPYELARTKALSYATMNLNLYVQLASVADKVGVDLWSYTAPNGGSIRAVLDWLVPYWTQAEPWPYQQIVPFSYARAIPILRRATWAYQAPGYEEAVAQLPLPPRVLAEARAQLTCPRYPQADRSS
jgi:hypothetical protein